MHISYSAPEIFFIHTTQLLSSAVQLVNLASKGTWKNFSTYSSLLCPLTLLSTSSNSAAISKMHAMCKSSYDASFAFVQKETCSLRWRPRDSSQVGSSSHKTSRVFSQTTAVQSCLPVWLTCSERRGDGSRRHNCSYRSQEASFWLIRCLIGGLGWTAKTSGNPFIVITWMKDKMTPLKMMIIVCLLSSNFHAIAHFQLGVWN